MLHLDDQGFQSLCMLKHNGLRGCAQRGFIPKEHNDGAQLLLKYTHSHNAQQADGQPAYTIIDCL